MNLKELNSLVDLFFYKAEKENPNVIFLEWLNPKNKKKYTWGETSTNIKKPLRAFTTINNPQQQTAQPAAPGLLFLPFSIIF